MLVNPATSELASIQMCIVLFHEYKHFQKKNTKKKKFKKNLPQIFSLILPPLSRFRYMKRVSLISNTLKELRTFFFHTQTDVCSRSNVGYPSLIAAAVDSTLSVKKMKILDFKCVLIFICMEHIHKIKCNNSRWISSWLGQ